MITKLKNCNKCDITMDKYQIYCRVNKDNFDEFIEIVRNEVDKWDSDGWDIPITVTIRTLIGVVR